MRQVRKCENGTIGMLPLMRNGDLNVVMIFMSLELSTAISMNIIVISSTRFL